MTNSTGTSRTGRHGRPVSGGRQPAAHLAAVPTSPADQKAQSASARQDWDELQRLWREQFRFCGFDAHPVAAAVYAAVPEDARRRYPILTWAWAVALGHEGSPGDRDLRVTRAFLRDAVALHADWRRNPDSDAAVLAGTMSLVSQQARPVDGSGVEETWRTRNAIAALVEERRRHGDPPSDDTAGLFHAKSSQLALMRADVETAVAEAERAVMFNVGTIPWVATGLRDLALELHGTPARSGPELPAELTSSDPPDLLGHAATLIRLAQAARALRQLDRDAVWEALGDVDDVQAEPCWPLRVGLAALAGAVWKNPEEALAQLNNDVGRNSVLSTEQHYPLGRIILLRSRALLLCKLNVPADSLELSRTMSEPWSWVPVTRALLWSGKLDEAIDTARAGLFVDPDTWNGDRVALSVLKAAAMASSTTRDADERQAAFARAIAACTRSESILPFALLPDFGLKGLVDYHDQTDCDGCILCDPETRRRLAQLPQAGQSGGLIRLTAREQELLPLLATDEPVPDIALRLHLSVGTVRKQVATLRAKFDARSRQELIRLARASGHLSGGR